MPQNNRSAMRGNFYHIVGSVRVRLGEKRDHRFVDAFAGGGLKYLAKHGTSGGKLMLQPQHGTADHPGFRPGKADHSNAAATWRRGNRDDGVVEVHTRASSSWQLAISPAVFAISIRACP